MNNIDQSVALCQLLLVGSATAGSAGQLQCLARNFAWVWQVSETCGEKKHDDEKRNFHQNRKYNCEGSCWKLGLLCIFIGEKLKTFAAKKNVCIIGSA